MIEIFEAMEQGSLPWFQARCGIPTASMFSAVLAKGEGKTRASYMRKLAAEIITGNPLESFTTPAMERGRVMEDEARDNYCFLRNVEVTRVGFVRNGKVGCSPDSLIGSNKVLEIKTQRGDLLIETIEKDAFPSEHKAQCQGNLWVTERDVVDITIYWPGMPEFTKTAGRDEAYIKTLSDEVDRFLADLDRMVEKVKTYGVDPLDIPAYLRRTG